MSNLILVFVCLLLGLLLQHSKRFPAHAPDALNAYIIYIALPALVLYEIPQLTLDYRALQPVVVAWVVMTLGALSTFVVARTLSWSRSTTGAMLLVVSLGNTGFVGIPLIDAHLGRNAIPYAILYDQFGTFLALNSFGIFVTGVYGQSHQQRSVPLWKNILSFPPFLALLTAFILRPLQYPGWANDVLAQLAATLVPVVMLAVGLQWRLKLEREHRVPLLIGLAFTLVLQPLFALLVVTLAGITGLVGQVIVLEAAMPAMISAGVLAMAHNLAPRLASAVVGYGLMLSLVSVWLWKLLLVNL